jgi:phage terminase large subunit-like protein
MIEGISGLLAVHAPYERPHYDVSRNQLQWSNGAIAQMYAADDPDNLRGPQFDAAWCDELAKWRRAQHAWDMLQFALRLGNRPQCVVTTTPRPIALLKKLMADGATVTSRAKTTDNAANLAPSFLASVLKRYGGTALGRQEIDGEIVEDRSGGLWRKSWFDQHRIAAPPELARIVVAVDPPVTSNTSSDACGIVVAGLGEDGRAYVLADYAAGWFTRGVLSFASGANIGRAMEIKNHAHRAGLTEIELWQSMGEPVAVGDAISVVAGCDKRLETCTARFANAVNYRGFPHMPGNDFLTAIALPGSAPRPAGSSDASLG